MMHSRMACVLFFSLLLPVASCKKDESPAGLSTATVPDALVGSWRASSATVNGNPSPLAAAPGWESRVASAVTDIGYSGTYGYAEFDSSGNVVHSAAGVLTWTGPSV